MSNETSLSPQPAPICTDDLRQLLLSSTCGPWEAGQAEQDRYTSHLITHKISAGPFSSVGVVHASMSPLSDWYAPFRELSSNARLFALAPQLAAEVLARRADLAAPSAPAEVEGLVKRANETLPNVSTPAMRGDNLANVVCGFFDNPEQDPDDETHWTPDGIAGYEETIAPIRQHYATALTALQAENERLRAIADNLEGVLRTARDYVFDASNRDLTARGGSDISVTAKNDLKSIDTALASVEGGGPTVWVSIKEGEIVGTPFGPDCPDGKYVRFSELASTTLAKLKGEA